ncbi:carboxypeptidase-like regulatory domain-containing protein [Sphingobacterium sp. SRCM116780]|uniref:carboxypeptidase-like regulatory domain-containing protein n=1 Tax=Sphingobacterium sp. SRCM116780 TaxID=2907623 RepID=UPI001F29D342|nr:carboxypeptidase-like regulatory domain-containing protein [Sphingobacterium sp. SRCM116780]UIR56810.1 carboxypeptidase-like regulatory domain-containing protein [Sphingobacterium sp. SRCM116780]
MRKQHYILNIENPCQIVQWDSMSKTESGKYCSHCSKNVVDFATLTDVEVIKYLDRTSGVICGRLTTEQLNRLLTIKQKSNNFQFSKILTALLILSATESSFATDKQLTPHEFVTEPNDKQSDNYIPTANKTLETDSLQKYISGKVIEEGTNRVVTLSSVFIKNTKISAQTDTLGNFKLQIPNDFVADTIILVVKHTGWERDTETIVYKKDLPITNLIINKTNPIVGEISIQVKRKWWMFWKKRYY